MDPLPPPPRPDPGLPTPDVTQRDLQVLRLTVQITLVALVILAGSIGIYLFRQVDLLRRQADGATRQAHALAQAYNSSFGPAAQNFERRLQEFAATNPDLSVRLARFYAPTGDTARPPEVPVLAKTNASP